MSKDSDKIEQQGFVFDFNGVLLWDTHFHEQAWRKYSKLIRGHELDDNEMLHEVHGKTNKDILEYVLGKGLDKEEVAKHANEKESIYRQLCLDSPNEFVLAPGAVELLDYLKQHSKPRTIATSSDIYNLRFFFDNLDLARWFDFSLVSYDDGTIKGKPEPDIYLKAFNNLGLRPDECLVVEDSKSGIRSAHNAKAGLIVAIGPKESQASLSEVDGVDLVITDFYELLDRVK